MGMNKSFTWELKFSVGVGMIFWEWKEMEGPQSAGIQRAYSLGQLRAIPRIGLGQRGGQMDGAGA